MPPAPRHLGDAAKDQAESLAGQIHVHLKRLERCTRNPMWDGMPQCGVARCSRPLFLPYLCPPPVAKGQDGLCLRASVEGILRHSLARLSHHITPAFPWQEGAICNTATTNFVDFIREPAAAGPTKAAQGTSESLLPAPQACCLRHAAICASELLYSGRKHLTARRRDRQLP